MESTASRHVAIPDGLLSKHFRCTSNNGATSTECKPLLRTLLNPRGDIILIGPDHLMGWPVDGSMSQVSIFPCGRAGKRKHKPCHATAATTTRAVPSLQSARPACASTSMSAVGYRRRDEIRRNPWPPRTRRCRWTATQMTLRAARQPTQARALSNSRCQGEHSPHFGGCHDSVTVRNTRSG